MHADLLSSHLDAAQNALESFMSTLLGGDVTLTLAEPDETTREDMAGALAGELLIESDGPFVVQISPDWVPVIAESMLGEPMDVDDDGMEDLLQEVAAQAYGTLRNQLASDDTPLPEYTLSAMPAGQAVLEVPEALWRLPFEATLDGQELSGAAILPRTDAPAADTDAAADEDEADEQDSTSSEAPDPADASTPEPEPAPAGATAEAETSSPGSGKVEVAPASFSELGDEALGGDGGAENLQLLSEIEIEVSVELGRREIPLADVLEFTSGSVIELEKLVGEPLNIYANGRFIAEGEAVVVDEKFGIRITKLAPKEQRGSAFL